jgi:AraC-like DNA-binding protein
MPAYTEWPAHPAVADFVVCTWIDLPRAARGPVWPDACIDVVWDGVRLTVVGPDTRAAPVSGTATFTGIRFKPGAAVAILGVAANELVDRQVALAEMWGRDAAELAEQLALDPARARAHLERAVFERQVSVRHEPDLTPRLLALINQPRSAVDALAHELGVSERTLRRHAERTIGYGPKMLDRVLRFRRAMRLIRRGWPLATTATAAGYADQAHLTREIQRLAGMSPSAVQRQPRLALSSNGW